MQKVDRPKLGLRDAVRSLEIKGDSLALEFGRGISLTAQENRINLILGKLAHVSTVG
ncbi:MAG: hypothetical protein ABSG41_19370 [Bryobacteraceae bacterium]|jgi:hypothetical protein